MPEPAKINPGGAERGRRVLFVIGTLEVGGTETQLAMLAEGLVRRGWTVEVFALDTSGPLAARLRPAGVAVSGRSKSATYRHPVVRVASLAGCQIKLLWRIARTRPDVVHGFLPLTNFMAVVAGRAGFVPRVVTSRRALGHHRERRPRLTWLDSVANAGSHVVTANSLAVARDMNAREGYPLDRIVVIPNGLDLGRFEGVEREREAVRRELGLAAGDIALVTVANLIPYKGHAELIAAFADLAPTWPSLRLFLVGRDDGPGAALAATAERLGVAGRVAFLGQRADVPRLLAAMDAAVVASHEEGSSNALIEQIAAGLPVVATAVGGNVEALAGVPDCALVPARDPVALAAGIAAIVEALPVAVSRRPERQRIARERYGVAEMIARYEHLYRSRGEP
jgi:glycosyltransferase involved in cell wall biosynthesis